MLILLSISSGLESWSLNHTSIYENPELQVFNNIKLSNIWPNYLLGNTLQFILYELFSSIILKASYTAFDCSKKLFKPSSFQDHCFHVFC